MRVGVPKEIKTHEYRVAMTPGAVHELTARGHEVLLERDAGVGSGIADGRYVEAGARIVTTAADAWSADLVVKVKEPQPSEYGFFREGLVLYTYLHLAAEPVLTRELVKQRVAAVAYETIQTPDGRLPLLRPMSEVAGRMAVQVGAGCLEKERGGKGVLLGGVPGTRRGRVVILGGGVVGRNAATSPRLTDSSTATFPSCSVDPRVERRTISQFHREAQPLRAAIALDASAASP